VSCPRDSYFDTAWNDVMIIRLIELREKNYTYPQMTDIINKEFSTQLTITHTAHGWKGSVVKKLEHLKENQINWTQYNDDELLRRDTIKMLDRLKHDKNRYFRKEGERQW
jgi:hypothetical protein